MEPGQFNQTNFLFYGLHQEQFSHAELLNACHAALHAERLETAALSVSVVEALVASSLFEFHGNGLRFGRNLAFINAALTKQLLVVAGTAAQMYERILRDELRSIRNLASSFTVKNLPMEWNETAHLIVAGLIIDLGFRVWHRHTERFRRAAMDQRECSGSLRSTLAQEVAPSR